MTQRPCFYALVKQLGSEQHCRPVENGSWQVFTDANGETKGHLVWHVIASPSFWGKTCEDRQNLGRIFVFHLLPKVSGAWVSEIGWDLFRFGSEYLTVPGCVIICRVPFQHQKEGLNALFGGSDSSNATDTGGRGPFPPAPSELFSYPHQLRWLPTPQTACEHLLSFQSQAQATSLPFGPRVFSFQPKAQTSQEENLRSVSKHSLKWQREVSCCFPL